MLRLYIIIGVLCATCIARTVPQREYVVELHSGQDPVEFGKQHHMAYIGPVGTLGTLKYFHRFTTTRHTEMRGIHERLEDASGVRWAGEQHMKMQYTRSAPDVIGRVSTSDPLYASQWHLHNKTDAGVRAKMAWEMGRTGKGVVIGIVDDGLQHTHPDLHDRYRADLSHNYNAGNSHDPMPNVLSDFHGTSASGVAAATCGNTHCGCGVAPGASLAGLRLIAGPISDAMEATALSAYADKIHIKSNSWGPMDNGMGLDGPGYITRHAFAQSAQHGRGGKGTIFVWAAGNGRHHRDQCGYDGYASSPYTIAVGAVDHTGVQSWYSESCAALLCVAPSSGGGMGITTTDVDMTPQHRGGYAPGQECNDSFGGTSSACPLVSGIVALLLEERPDLHWRDVQGLIANTSHIIDETDADWSTNINGYHHSHRYGFGRIDAPDILLRAKHWQSLPPQMGYSSDNVVINRAISVIGTPVCYTHTFSNAPMHFIEHVMLHVKILHPRRGQIRIRLQSPQHAVSVLADTHPDQTSNYPTHGWMFTSMRHWGESDANGKWVICVSDTQPGDSTTPGTFQSFQLNVFGH